MQCSAEISIDELDSTSPRRSAQPQNFKAPIDQRLLSNFFTNKLDLYI